MHYVSNTLTELFFLDADSSNQINIKYFVVVETLQKFLSLLMSPRQNEKSATPRILANAASPRLASQGLHASAWVQCM